MTFEQWYDKEGGYDGSFDTYESAAEAAWDYQQKRIDELEAGIVKTLEDNLHLTDGDNCTLYELKKLVRWD